MSDVTTSNNMVQGTQGIVAALYHSAYYGALRGEIKPEELYQSSLILFAIFRDVKDKISISKDNLHAAAQAAAPHIMDMVTQYEHFRDIPVAAPDAFFRAVLEKAEFPDKEALSPTILARIEANTALQAYRLKERMTGYGNRLEDSSVLTVETVPSSLPIPQNKTSALVAAAPTPERSIKMLRWRIAKEADVKGDEWLREEITFSYSDGIGCLREQIETGQRGVKGMMIGGVVSTDEPYIPEQFASFTDERDLIEKIRLAYGDDLLERAGVNLQLGGLLPTTQVSDADPPKLTSGKTPQQR